MSMFKKIKSLFVIEETLVQQKNSGQTEAQSTVAETSDAKTEQVQPDKESFDRFIQVLSDAVAAKNQQGYDYLEFKEAVNSLLNMEPDEGKRYLTAFTLAKTLGVEKKALLDSAAHYLNILKNENDKFSAAVENQRVARIKSRNEDLAKTEQELSLKEKQIRELLDQIESLKKSRENIRLEMEEAARKVDQVQSSFRLAYETIVGQIRKDLEKMNQYLN